MLVKIAVNVNHTSSDHDHDSGNFNVIASNGLNQRFIMRFDESESFSVKEDILDLESSSELNLTVMFDGDFTESRTITIPIAELESRDYTLFEPTASREIELKAHIVIVERAPSNWFDYGIQLLETPNKAWYFKAEDLYAFLKHILHNIQVNSVSLFEEFCRLVDYASRVVLHKYLKIELIDGFSMVEQVDHLLESLFASFDGYVDNSRFKLAGCLQQLRKHITAYLQQLAIRLNEKNEELKQHVKSLRHGWIAEILSTAFQWAGEKTEETATWIGSEKDDIFVKIAAASSEGKARLSSAQETILAAPSIVYSSLANQVSTRIQATQNVIKNIPAIAHPYVHTVAEITQPYVVTAITKATPIINNIKSTPLVENLILDTKDAIEKHEVVNALVHQVIGTASTVMEEVTAYCLDEHYFGHSATAAIQVNENVSSEEVKVGTI